MKKLYILIVVLLMNIIPIYAQLSLTYATHGIAPGDEYSYYYGDTNFIPGAGGANTTWTFSGWNIGALMETIDYISIDSTPYAASFPTASYATEYNGLFTYYKAATAGNYCEGIADAIKTIVMPDDEIVTPYPITYPNNSFDYFSGSVTVSGTKYARNGKNSWNADGWGKLVINGRTFNNVLRIKYFLETSYYEIKTSNSDTIVATHTKSTIYHWYWASYKNPIINYTETKTYTFHNTTPDKVEKTVLVENRVTSINDKHSEQIDFSVYPNPAKGYVNLESSFKSPQKLNIQIVNTSGQIVYTEDVNAGTGLLNHKIDVATLPLGIYTLKIMNNEIFGVRKLILQ